MILDLGGLFDGIDFSCDKDRDYEFKEEWLIK